MCVKAIENDVAINKISLNRKAQPVIEQQRYQYNNNYNKVPKFTRSKKCKIVKEAEGTNFIRGTVRTYNCYPVSNWRRDLNTLFTPGFRRLPQKSMKFWKWRAFFGRTLEQKTSVVLSEVAGIALRNDLTVVWKPRVNLIVRSKFHVVLFHSRLPNSDFSGSRTPKMRGLWLSELR